MRNISQLERALAWEAPEPNRRTMGVMFERDITPTRNIAAGYVRIPPGGKQVRMSVHEGVEEIYFVVTGRARYFLGDETFELDTWSAVYVPPGTPHKAENSGDTDLILYFVNTPSAFGEPGGYRRFVTGWTQVAEG